MQDSSAAQHAQQEADSTGDITDLTQANSQLLTQVAEYKAQVVQAQQEAQSATGQLQHMRELVKAQHAKREEHAASLQAELDSLQQECKAKDLKVGILRQMSSITTVCMDASDSHACSALVVASGCGK